jgi:glutaminyl-peptide cyclotransferase
MLLLRQINLFICGLLLVNSCNNKIQDTQSDADIDSTEIPVVHKRMLLIDTPLGATSYAIGDEVDISVKLVEGVEQPDSIQVFAGNILIGSTLKPSVRKTWKSSVSKTGRYEIKAIAWQKGEIKDKQVASVIMRSDIAPRQLRYKLIRTYPHDPKAYTQGLVYEDGILYESTGQYGQSTLRKVKLETGEVMQSVNLDNQLFGEGMTVTADRIIQITWKTQLGFVYDKKSFRQLSKFNFQTREGWGLTYDGSQFIMSDGSELLYFWDTEYYAETARVEVYDNKGPVPYINELEFIKGDLYANVYGQSFIVVIDPSTGKVKAIAELKDLVPREYKNNSDRVLNGIAWNPENGHLFITGKYWPVLYEIQLY